MSPQGRSEGVVGGLLADRDMVTGQQIVVATTDHALSEVAHDQCGLYHEVPVHGIRLPSANEADGVSVHVAAEQRHSS